MPASPPGSWPGCSDADSSLLIAPDLARRLPLEAIYGRGAPLEVDIGCGKGRFLAARAGAFPEINFLGIDRQRGRLLKAEKKARRAGLSNVRLLQIEASHAVACLLPAASVRTFYVFFPDPWPKRRHHERRLFGEGFLDAVHEALSPGGCVHVATDHADYLSAIDALFRRDARFEAIAPFVPSENEKTEFERMFLGLQVQAGRRSFRRRP